MCSPASDGGDPSSQQPDDGLDDAWIGGKADGYSSDRRYEVLLTDPFCDVCQSDDKGYLLDHSRMIERSVELIDGAKSTIEIAQYTFSRREIEEALLRAHERGVRVRIGMDVGQDRDGSVARRLRDAGIDVRFVRGKKSGDRYGLQHNKYMIVDGATLWTGSNNWSSTGTSINEENAIVIGSVATDPLLEAFSCDFEAIWAGKVDEAGACSNDTVVFTPSARPKKRITNELRASKESIDVLMHHLTFGDLVKELAKAAERGVRVRVVMNAADRDDITGDRWDRLIAAGGEIRYKQTNEAAYQLMHDKLAIIDGKLLIDGSGNWSGSGFFNNHENYVRYAEPRVVDPFVALYDRLWRWSLSAESLDAGRTAAVQHAEETNVYFGDLRAHIHAVSGDRLLDDGKALRLDAEGNEIPVDTGATVPDATRYALEYGRDRGGLDFLAITPHVMGDGAALGSDVASMSASGYREIVETARFVTQESSGAFVGLAGMEWGTDAAGNRVNVLGSEQVATVPTGAFADLYEKFLPLRVVEGDRPVLQFDAPHTFPMEGGQLAGPWDQIFDVPLTDIEDSSEREAKFNDYGLDDYEPLSAVHDDWVAGLAMPDPAIVDATVANIEQTVRPYGRMMEATFGRGAEIGHELGENPSLVPSDEDPDVLVRETKIHSDWDYYLLHGFLLAPTANQDAHYANWGTGQSSRTAIVSAALTEQALLDAIRQRLVYASEDQNLEVRLYADGRIAMGGEMATLSTHVSMQMLMQDEDFEGPYEVTVYRGRVEGDDVQAIAVDAGVPGGSWHSFDVGLPEAGRWFVYVQVHEVQPDRMAWTAPIWVERLVRD